MKIRKLILYSSALQAVQNFYVDVLGFTILTSTENTFTLKVGQSILEFRESQKARPYHFAFNIPRNLIRESHRWLKDRVDLIPFEGKDQIEFDFWDASAFYFYDPDMNIVEFIARRPLPIDDEAPFAPEKIINISEMAFAVESIQPIFETLNSSTGIEVYSGAFDRFLAAGGAEGLFIIIDQNKKKTWFPTNDSPQPVFFGAFVEVNSQDYEIQFNNGEISVTKI